LAEFVKFLGQKARNSFREALNEVSKEVLNRDADYYDDFYFFRNKVYKDIESRLSVDPLLEVKKILRTMEFDLGNIHFDTEDRKNKYPSPICFFVQIPHDIRVLYKNESPYFDLQGCFHETGHAMHASSIDENSPYWHKYRISMGIAEIFSILLERITKNKIYLQSLLGKDSSEIIDKIHAKNKFLELFFVTFYAANSLMKLEFWNKNLTVDEACKVYASLIKDYTGFEVPGQYWLLHHILPESIMYVPSYLLAAVRAAELESHMKNRFGDTWWYNNKSGKELREIMKPGAQIDLSIFSKLDPKEYLMEILN
jgi:Zn-dependent M32 family carboxypeptidase